MVLLSEGRGAATKTADVGQISLFTFVFRPATPLNEGVIRHVTHLGGDQPVGCAQR